MDKENKINLTFATILPEKLRNKGARDIASTDLKPAYGSRRDGNRVGRGRSAGQGKTCGRGQKGQKARSGSSTRPGFEGGQMPLHRRLPKRGFTNIFKKKFQLVNLVHLNSAGLSGDIDPIALVKAGLVKYEDRPIKILGMGEISSALKITADAFSVGSKAKIESAGGACSIREKITATKEA